MCIFTGEVRYVGGTKIFARLAGPEQYLVYQMAFAADRELAMVLPLPVAPGMGESAVRFIDLAGYPSFFDDLAHTFPVALAFGGGGDVPAALPVHRVGEFDASFVPSGLDFGRLDARFRLRPELWQALPGYSDFGFAVFKLRHEKPSWLSSLGFGASRQPEVSRVHPMALAFRTRSPHELFFPTVHVHAGRFEARAGFDHELFCQSEFSPTGWFASSRSIGAYEVAKSSGVLDSVGGVFRLSLVGEFENHDVRVSRPRVPPAERVPDTQHLDLVFSQPVVSGALAPFDNVFRNLLAREVAELEKIHRSMVSGWSGRSLLRLELDAATGVLLGLEVESGYPHAELRSALEEWARAFRVPPLPSEGRGRVELSFGLGIVPRSPVPA
ncbi:MAG: hypothetical protein U0263_17540 [Polyangiaceae bacterium]